MRKAVSMIIRVVYEQKLIGYGRIDTITHYDEIDAATRQEVVNHYKQYDITPDYILIHGSENNMTIYRTRYQARKAKRAGEVTVKVYGGYTNMDARDYYIWRWQK